MRTTMTLPLLGAAVVTAGAVVLGLLRNRPAPAGPAPRLSEAARPGSLVTPLSDATSLLERLRERGF